MPSPEQLSSVIDTTKIAAMADSTKVVLENFAQGVIENPSGTLQMLAQKAIVFGIKVAAAILIYLLGAWIIRHVKRALSRTFARRSTDKTLASFISSFVTIVLTIILFIITISTLGINTTSLAALLAAGGVAIGMALSGTAQNFAGGIMIMVFKPFKAGDYIETQGQAGFVKEMSMVNTTLTTFDNNNIILPNGTLFNGNINNFSRNPYHRVDWKISLEYGCDADHAIETMLGIVSDDPRVILHGEDGVAEPSAVLSNLADSAVEFTVKAWVRTPDYWSVKYDLNRRLYTELPKAGFEFPFPQMDIHVKN